MTIPKTKIIGGKRYSSQGVNRSVYKKSDADKKARQYRKDGYNARVVKYKNVYVVFVAKKSGARGMNKGMDKIKYYSDKQMKTLLKTSKRDWESLALKKGYDVDMRNYKWFKKKR